MKTLFAASFACCMVACLAVSASAQIKESEDRISDDVLRTAIAGTFMEINCYVPEIQPDVVTITSNCSHKSDDLIKKFFGTRDAIMSIDDIVSPVWGPGQRVKSGTVIYLTPKDMPEQQRFASSKAVEMVPAYLDIYGHGFIYGNNIPQKPVLATDVDVVSELRANVSEYYEYDEAEGLRAAESTIANMVEEIGLPAGFQSSVTSLVDEQDLRLYIYRAYPQHVTTFRHVVGHETDAKGNILPVLGDEQPVAIPVLDRYVEVRLDGDKLLAGMEYFWDSKLTASGTPKRAISAQEAIIKAREVILADYNFEPPLINVNGIRLAYVQDGGSSTRLVPAWLFDASYTRQATPEEQVSQGLSGISQSLVAVPIPFAVNAITGQVFQL